MSGNRWYPNTTQVPNHFLDFIAPKLNQAELKVALYILRRTYGFQKEWDKIALSQLVDGMKRGDGSALNKGTGLSKTSVIAGIKGLEAKGLITAHRTPKQGRKPAETTHYRLNAALFDGAPGGSQDSDLPPLGSGQPAVLGGSQDSHPRVVQEVDQQNQHVQKQTNKNGSGPVEVEETDEAFTLRVARRYSIPANTIPTLVKLSRDDAGRLRRAAFEEVAYKNRGLR